MKTASYNVDKGKKVVQRDIGHGCKGQSVKFNISFGKGIYDRLLEDENNNKYPDSDTSAKEH